MRILNFVVYMHSYYVAQGAQISGTYQYIQDLTWKKKKLFLLWKRVTSKLHNNDIYHQQVMVMTLENLFPLRKRIIIIFDDKL